MSPEPTERDPHLVDLDDDDAPHPPGIAPPLIYEGDRSKPLPGWQPWPPPKLPIAKDSKRRR